jgi:beta-mannosidase
MAPQEPALDAISPLELLPRWHDKTGKGTNRFVEYVELHYPPAANLEEWIYTSQLNQRDALRFGIEHYRRSEFCKGTLIWQFNDCWPVQSWAVVDCEGQYKAAAYELRRLYAPLLVSLVRRDAEADLWVVLDNTRAPIVGQAVIEAWSLSDGMLLGRWDTSLAVTPGERRAVLSAQVSSFDPFRTLLSASFSGASTVALLCEPKQLELMQPRLKVTAADGTLHLESDVPVVDLYLEDEGGQLEFGDNYITLPAGGAIDIRARGRAQALRGRSVRGRHRVELHP